MKSKLLLSFIAAAMAATTVNAENIDVKSLRYSGPYNVAGAFVIDSIDASGARYNTNDFVGSPLSLDLLDNAYSIADTIVPSAEGKALHLLGFDFTNTTLANVTISIDTDLAFKLYMDGNESMGSQTMEPGTHKVAIKYATTSAEAKSLKVSIAADKDGILSLANGERMYTLHDVMYAKRASDVSLSKNGKYMMVTYSQPINGQHTDRYTVISEITNSKKGFSAKPLTTTDKYVRWMPTSNRYYYSRYTDNGQDIIAVDPATNTEVILAHDAPTNGYFFISPTEDFIIFTMAAYGTPKDNEVYEIQTPEDRQPNYRSRYYPVRYDIKTGRQQRLVYSQNNITPVELSADGTKLLFHAYHERLEQRPTTLYDIYVLDLNTLEADKIVEGDGFVSSAGFSPDGKQIVVIGSPESFNGIGLNVPDDITPSMVDQQLYTVDIATRRVTPLTKNFNPSVNKFTWHDDGMIYFSAENKDRISLYRLDPKTQSISQFNTDEEITLNFDVEGTSPIIAYVGQSASNSDRLYLYNTKTRKSTLIDDISAETLKGITLGECHEWNFINSKGDTINGRYYLPPHFDESKSYPMIVNYYGGCSPTSRYFESRYPHHAYAALGYIVYVLNPSGATGFGQEFSSRHVNTAGEGPTQDIIEGVKQFCAQHSYVNAKKIGCIGASYGGFMTQYLQTKTDIFAAAISHAGISDHTSYWGEGYWGYSYSEVSMANTYPWTRKDLYVDRSPLYNADKVNTPLLFIHGTADTNVPVGESIQMFTALKLLGKETAFVAVEGENHHILDYSKRVKWQNTIYAWFAKWLKDDPSWWETLYGKK